MNTRSSMCILEGERVLLVRQRHSGRAGWPFPGGAIEPGETAREAAVREVREETGLAAEAVRLLEARRQRSAYGLSYCFLGRVTGGDLPLGSDPALAEVRWRPVAEVRAHPLNEPVFATLEARQPGRSRAVLFDFDFTLCDSSTPAVDCMRHGMAAAGLPAPSRKAALGTIGLSLPETFYALAGVDEADRPAQADRCRRFQEAFLQRAAQVMVRDARLYPGVVRVVARLRELGFQLAVVSTKFRHRIEVILARAGLDGSCDVIVGGEDVEALKPSPVPVRMALQSLGRAPEEAILVGDSRADAGAATAAGVPFIGVRSGTTPEALLRAHGPVAILDDVTRLPGLLGPPEGQAVG